MMPELLHEYWESEAGATFGAVREHNDRIMPAMFPNARLVFSLRAASWFQAMQLHNERLGFGDFLPPEDVPDHFYTVEEAAEQEAYLRERNVR